MILKEDILRFLNKMSINDMAKQLGISQRTLCKKMKKYDLHSTFISHRATEGQITIQRVGTRGNYADQKMIKVEGKWVRLDKYTIEQVEGVKLPSHFKIIHLDGDQLNCDYDNLKVITIQEASKMIWDNPTMKQVKNIIRMKSSLTVDDIPDDLAEIKMLQLQLNKSL